MKYLSILIILLLFSCSDEISPCYEIKQRSIEVRKQMEQSEGEEYDKLKAEYLELKEQAAQCYSQL